MQLLDAIIIALFSAFISFIVQYFFKYRDYKTKNESLNKAIFAEIAALISISETRNFISYFNDAIKRLENNPELPVSLTVEIQDDYCLVYKNNIQRIGEIPVAKITDIVRFYSLVASFVQDIKPGGILNNGNNSGIAAFKESLAILEEALELGKKIIQK